MIEATMGPDELLGWRTMTGLTRPKFAAKLGVSAEDLKQMETGRKPIPARFDDDVERAFNDSFDD